MDSGGKNCDIASRVVPLRKSVLSFGRTGPAALHRTRSFASAGRVM